MKKTMKRITSLLLCVLVVASAVVITVSGASVPTLNKHTLFIDGYNEGGTFVFKPDVPMKRSEAIKVLAVVARHTDSFDASTVKTSFTDLSGSEWYASYVKYLEKYDMLDFWGKTLSADKGITRAEFVKLISPYVPQKSGNKSFPDVPTTHPYYDAIIAAAKAGIVEGNPDGTFNPDGTLTRAQIVTIIDRLIGRNIVDGNTAKVTKFSDVKGHWAEKYVIAASCSATYEGMTLWYTGNAYAANSPVDKTKLDYSTTKAVLSGVDVTNATAVEKAVKSYTDKRIAEIKATTSDIKPAEGKKAYYVSNSGNDANNGLTPETAWATLEKVSGAALKSGDVVYFKRGDTFRGQLKTKYGVSYSAYGEGAKPNLYGSLKNYAGGTFWQPVEGKKNQYVSSDTFDLDVGLIVFNNGEAWSTKKAKGINGTSLLLDLDMYHNTEDKKVYIYSTSDPNTRFKSIEICFRQHVITGNATNVVLDNLCVKYTGAHGVGFGGGYKNITIQNCEFGWIGGSLQRTGNDPVRYGNAIEIYGAVNGFTVENCYIYEIYDAAVTHQYFESAATGGGSLDMKKIKYIDNVITNSTYAIEYVNNQTKSNGIMQDVEISGNVFATTGDGWGNQRPDRGGLTAAIKGWGGEDCNYSKNFVISDNVLYTKNAEAATLHMTIGDVADLPEITGNLILGKNGYQFGYYGEHGVKMITYNAKLTDKTIGLDDNTLVFLK